MAQYNLIRNGFIESLTMSGTGNKELTASELSKLYDGITTTSGLVLGVVDEVFLEIDLINRIHINGCSIYFDVVGSRSTALSKISFYYKNEAIDDYSLLTTADDTETFYATNVPTLFAPRYMRIVISNVEGTLQETIVYNDDYDVAFGHDGTTTELEMDEFAEYSTIPIYNNDELGTGSVDAYISVDFKNNPLDYYLKLSSSPDGEFKGVSDAIGINNSKISTYEWGMGSFINTIVTEDSTLTLIPYNYRSLGIFIGTYSFKTNIPLTGYYSSSASYWYQCCYGWGSQQNCWDWADDGYIYAIGRSLDVQSSIKLYRFDTLLKEWTFLYELFDIPFHTTSTYDHNNSMGMMSCLGNYVYVMGNQYGYWGRHDLTGAPGNWEELPTAELYLAGDYDHKRAAMCSDKVRYIYTLNMNYYTDPRRFYRYDTTDGTWTALDTTTFDDYSHTHSNYMSFTLCYDPENNCLYQSGGESGNITSDAVQKYYIANDVWDKYWRLPIPAEGAVNRGICFYGGFFVYISKNTDYASVCINGSNETYQLQLPYESTSLFGPYMLAFPSADGGVTLAVTRLTDSPNEMIYYYDLGRAGDTDITGYYTSPVMYVEDRHKSSYIHMDYTVVSGTSISYNAAGPADTLLVRSSNTQPVVYSKIFNIQKNVDDVFYLVQGDLRTNNLIEEYDYLSLDNSDYHPKTILFDKTNSSLVFLLRETDSTNTAIFLTYDLLAKKRVYSSSWSVEYLIEDIRHLDIDITGNVWGYYNTKLFKLPKQLSSQELVVQKDYNDFVYAIAASQVYAACWYTDKATKVVVHINELGEEICSVPLSEPTHICSTLDGGCIVLDSASNTLKKLSYGGDTITTIDISTYYNVGALLLSSIQENHLWILDSYIRLLKINMEGDVLLDISVPSATSLVDDGVGGCLVHAEGLNVTYQISSDGALLNTWDFTVLSETTYKPCVAYYSYDELLDKSRIGLFEETDDPFWSNTSGGWKEMTINESVLPIKNYHQFKIKMHSDIGAASPSVNKLLIPEPVKISDLNPKTSKPVYIKTEFPMDAENKEYETKLRCWWGK